MLDMNTIEITKLASEYAREKMEIVIMLKLSRHLL